MPSKTASERIHARRRAGERYGINVSRYDIDDVVKAIQTGKATFVSRQSLRVTVWDVVLHEQACRVVYDKKRQMVVTFLPAEPVGQAEGTS